MEYSILFALLFLMAIGVSYYFLVKFKIEHMAADAIISAEELDIAGEQKMEMAINILYSIVPVGLKPLFPRWIIREIVQTAFDKIENYAIM